MKAIVYDRYGPPEVLRIADVPKPEPKPDEILVKIHAAGVSRADVHTREANRKSGALVSGISRVVSGVRRPRQPILGTDFAGEVAAVGSTAAGFKVGDAVFGSMGFRFGGWAEFAVVRADRLVALKPASLTFEQAAPTTDGGLYAQCLKVARIQTGHAVLVYGASGPSGPPACSSRRASAPRSPALRPPRTSMS